jgi:hypothetical protein
VGLTCVEAAARRGISGAFLLFSDVFHAKLTMPLRIRRDHPLRAIRSLTDAALAALSADCAALYSGVGRPSIPPEMLLLAMLLQAFYSVRSERQLMERLEFDLLFRWFVGIGVDDAVWDHSTSSKKVFLDQLHRGRRAGGSNPATVPIRVRYAVREKSRVRAVTCPRNYLSELRST